MEDEAVLLESLQLANHLSVSLFDLSRRVAADRWLVKVKCVACAELPQDFFEKKMEEEGDPDLVAGIKDKFGGRLLYEAVRELNFVDETEKDESVRFLTGSLKENSIAYLSRDSFINKLLLKRYDEFRQEIITARELGPAEQDDEGEDDGPADFSACFKD